jgi:hypothetical protein
MSLGQDPALDDRRGAVVVVAVGRHVGDDLGYGGHVIAEGLRQEEVPRHLAHISLQLRTSTRAGRSLQGDDTEVGERCCDGDGGKSTGRLCLCRQAYRKRRCRSGGGARSLFVFMETGHRLICWCPPPPDLLVPLGFYFFWKCFVWKVLIKQLIPRPVFQHGLN